MIPSATNSRIAMIQKLRSLIENGVTTVNDAPVTVAFDYMATGMAYGDDDFFGEDEDFLKEEEFDHQDWLQSMRFVSDRNG